MKSLFPRQRDAVDFHLRVLSQRGASLDTSKTGTGKTIVSAHVAREYGGPVAVICPKIVIPHWRRELEAHGVEPVFVLNYEKLRTGRTQYLFKQGKKSFTWLMPNDILLIFDECHKCMSPTSQNSMMLVAAKQQGLKCLLLSATACQDPTEMRSIGYALGVHNLLRAEHGLPSWVSWMKSYGCWQDQWRNWNPPRNPQRLKPLNAQLYSTCAVQLRPSDLPAAFAENHVITEPLEFSAIDEIRRYYDESGLESQILDLFLADPTGGAGGEVLVELLRARQLAEAAKVPDIIEMANDLVGEGSSVVIFVNFRETAQHLFESLPLASLIIGGQSDAERERMVQDFQSDLNRVAICVGSAGGVGVSLHDMHGNYPRVSLISPSYDYKEYVQVLGRIHRNGAKSPATQRVLVAAGTIEEKVIDALERKRQYMDTLHTNP